MPANRASRGVPLPTFGQWLVIAAALGAACFVWWELRGPRTDSAVSLGGAEYAPNTAAFENLREFESLARTGAHGVPALVAALADANPRMRRNALMALRLIGPEAGEALAHVRERLTDEDERVRAVAVDTYWRIRRDPDDVAAAVAPLLGDRDAQVRFATASVLETIGPPAIGPLAEALTSDGREAAIPALKSLRQIGWDGSQMAIEDAVRARLDDGEARVEALLTLAAWGHPTALDIREMLHHKEPAGGPGTNPPGETNLHEMALRAIIRLGPDAAENLNDVVDLLTERLARDSRAPVWNSALAALRAMQFAARPAAPRLLQLANDNQDYRRLDLGWTLLAIGADPQEIIRIVVPLLHHKDSDLSFGAGRLCAIASPEDARQQVSLLIPRLAPEKIVFDRTAQNAVWGLAPCAQEAIPALCRLLESNQPIVAQTAAKTLSDMGHEAEPAIPILLVQLARGPAADKDAARAAFCEALGKIGPAARSAVPHLVAELNNARLSPPPASNRATTARSVVSSGQRQVSAALRALIRIGDFAPDVIVAVRRHLANENDSLVALRALRQMTPDSPEVLSDHLNCLRDNRWSSSRIEVMLAIGRLPGERLEAVAPLSTLLTERAPEIRKAAAWSLGKIGPNARNALPDLREALNAWENSLYTARSQSSLRRPGLNDDPRSRFESGRWGDSEELSPGQTDDPHFHEKSVRRVVLEAIAKIETGSTESNPSSERASPGAKSSP
ncbi:MAG: HEAT repeat domain-containing protein [Planctomycetia bacterium]|nr:HEAT repeat domain-containing protein [Planctomycetia bacterium]